MPKGEIVGMFYRKSVLVIDGKNNFKWKDRLSGEKWLRIQLSEFSSAVGLI
jgi:hypothetical protein